jgi:peptidoglycan/LPS O-acetylase OafA/YrhL
VRQRCRPTSGDKRAPEHLHRRRSSVKMNLTYQHARIEAAVMPPHASSEDRGNKLLGLEAIRFVCAVSVLFWHYQHFSNPTDFVADRQPLYSIFRLMYEYGYLGVPVFWCISGFIFFWKYKKAIGDQIVGYRKFFILRFSRLYPLHFATLLLVAMLQIVYFSKNGTYFIFKKNDSIHFFLQLFMASNWGSTTTLGDSFNGPIWSISIEVLIYCIFFLTLRYVGKSALINLGIVLVCFIAKLAKVTTPIVDCLAFFYIGGLSAIALQYFEKTKYQRILTVSASCVALLVPVLVLATNLHQRKHFIFFFLITYVPTLLYICGQNVPVHPSVQRIIEAAGNMTYSSYLIHFPIQLAIALIFTYLNQPIPYDHLSFFCFFFFATLIAAYYIYRFFEVPAQTYIRSRRSPVARTTA